jgi:hypothetical protein
MKLNSDGSLDRSFSAPVDFSFFDGAERRALM